MDGDLKSRQDIAIQHLQFVDQQKKLNDLIIEEGKKTSTASLNLDDDNEASSSKNF